MCRGDVASNVGPICLPSNLIKIGPKYVAAVGRHAPGNILFAGKGSFQQTNSSCVECSLEQAPVRPQLTQIVWGVGPVNCFLSKKKHLKRKEMLIHKRHRTHIYKLPCSKKYEKCLYFLCQKQDFLPCYRFKNDMLFIKEKGTLLIIKNAMLLLTKLPWSTKINNAMLFTIKMTCSIKQKMTCSIK